MLLNVPLLHHQKSDYHKTKKKRKSLDKGGRSFISSTPIRDGKATIFSPLTKSHDVAYDSYRDSGYLTRVQCLLRVKELYVYHFSLSLPYTVVP